jgi:hypothetical protein
MTDLDRLHTLAKLGEAVVALVSETRLLRKKPRRAAKRRPRRAPTGIVKARAPRKARPPRSRKPRTTVVGNPLADVPTDTAA